MSQANPYEKFLEARDPLPVLASTTGRIERIVSGLNPQQTNAERAPGKWSARQIVCHLADCELVFAFRLRQTLAEDRHTIQPFDQDKFAINYAAYSMDDALAAFKGTRNWNLALLRSLSPGMNGKTVTHPERGKMTFSTIVETMAGHDLNHLGQLDAIAKKFAPAH